MSEIYIPGLDRNGQRTWPFLGWHYQNLRMRMAWMRLRSEELADQSGISKQYISYLRREDRKNPSQKALNALSIPLKVLWFPYDKAHGPQQNPAPPGYTVEGELLWPLMEWHPDTLNMRIQWARTNPNEIATDTGIPEEEIRKMMTQHLDVDAENRQKLGKALSCMFMKI